MTQVNGTLGQSPGLPMVNEFRPRMRPDEARAFTRRRRGRNIAILVALVCLCVLFYAIAMVKLAHGQGA